MPLGVRNSTSAGEYIVQSTCTAAANQRWTFVPVIGFTYQFRNANSDMCIQSENLSPDMEAALCGALASAASRASGGPCTS